MEDHCSHAFDLAKKAGIAESQAGFDKQLEIAEVAVAQAMVSAEAARQRRLNRPVNFRTGLSPVKPRQA
jgi:hypothetical protein